MFVSPVVNFFSQVPLHLTEELHKKPKAVPRTNEIRTPIFIPYGILIYSFNTTLSLVINIDLSFEAWTFPVD